VFLKCKKSRLVRGTFDLYFLASIKVMKLSYTDNYLSIIIKDNGKGFDPQEIESQDDKIKSSGLKNIRHRS
jgi:signal transduction histidine kinase